MNINTIDAEAFRGTTFFTLTPKRSFGNRAKIKNHRAHLLYQEMKEAEIAAKNGKKIDRSLLAADDPGKADESKVAVSGTKKLLASPNYDALCRHLTETKTEICTSPRAYAQASQVFRGIYVVRDDLISRVDADVTAAREKLTGTWIDDKGEVRPGYLTAFLDGYQDDIERTRTAPLLEGGLGPLFDPADYWTRAELETAFELDFMPVKLGIPEDLPPALKQKALENFQNRIQTAEEKCLDALYCSVGGFVDNLVDKLAPTEDGRPKVFRDTLTQNIRDFCASFDSKMIFRGEEADKLTSIVEKARKILEDATITPDNLRKYRDVRENTQRKFAQIQADLNSAIETRKGRSFNFDE